MTKNDFIKGGFKIMEPIGHFDKSSKLERYWARFSGPLSLKRDRALRYAPYAGLVHAPMEYSMTPFKINNAIPDENWIIDNLKYFIKTEFHDNHKESSPICPIKEPISPKNEITLNENWIDNFLHESEWINRIEINLPMENSPKEIAESIYELLCDNRIGSSLNRGNNNKEEFINSIISDIESKNRLLFLLPGFPFKDQNCFRVPFDASLPDFGEISFLLRLHNIVQTIYQVHPYGVDILILSDGFLYNEIFEVQTEDVQAYSNRLLYYRNRLNLQGAISIISLKELIDRSSDESTAWKVAHKIKLSIQEIYEKGEIKNLFDILISGMKWNLNSNDLLKDLPIDDCWKILKWDRENIKPEIIETWDNFHGKAFNAALEYASINLMLKWTNLISLFFPDAIRATIHPKKNQFAFSGSSKTHSWNGVAISKNWPRNLEDIKVAPFYHLKDFSSVYKVIFENSNLPCFFTEEPYHNNINLASKVLKPEGWQIGNISGRELKPSDLNDFIELGLNDKNFSWERKLQDENYFMSLFHFRLSHYKRFKFGVHGIWYKGQLIGQFGLQVLKESSDDIEFVIFLSKDYVGKGIGVNLVSELKKRCKQIGLNKIYGVVRPENSSAIKLLKKIEGVEIKSIKHFNQEGILYEIDTKH